MVRNKKKSNPGVGAGCLILFALPFASVGIFMSGWAVKTVIDHMRVSHWHEVPCTILEAELVDHSDSDGTTYEATARYSYYVGDKRYEGTRVSLHAGADNIGSFQQDAHNKLASHQKTELPFPGFVNPNDPSDSILFRDARWGLVVFKAMFGLVFGGVGFGLIVGTLVARRKAAVEKAQTVAHPDKPWLWKEAWATGHITSSNKTVMRVALLFALIWNLVSVPLLFFLPNEIIKRKNTLAAIGFVFPLIGVGLIIWATRAVLQWRKFGESIFEMASVPGVLGGSLAGVIRFNKSLEAREGYRQTLRCVKRRTSGSGKNRSTTETTLWQDERTIARPLSGPGEPTVVPVAFAMPLDMPASTTDGGRTEVIWRLDVSAAVPGIDCHATFDVPVFKTSQSHPDFQLDESLLEDYAAARDPEQELRRSGVARTPAPTGRGDRYIFPMFRHPWTIVFLGLFTLVWTSVVVGLTIGNIWFFAAVFGLFNILLILVLLDLMLYRSVVDVARDRISVRAGLFGMGRLRQIEASQLARLEPARGMQSGSQVYYGVAAMTTDGKKITLGKRLANRRLAEVVIEQMKHSMEG